PDRAAPRYPYWSCPPQRGVGPAIRAGRVSPVDSARECPARPAGFGLAAGPKPESLGTTRRALLSATHPPVPLKTPSSTQTPVRPSESPLLPNSRHRTSKE